MTPKSENAKGYLFWTIHFNMNLYIATVQINIKMYNG